MLVLSRQRDETIMIGDNIEVTVVDVRGDKVRLGITAPKSITVHRKEVYEAIRKEKGEAAQAPEGSKAPEPTVAPIARSSRRRIRGNSGLALVCRAEGLDQWHASTVFPGEACLQHYPSAEPTSQTSLAMCRLGYR